MSRRAILCVLAFGAPLCPQSPPTAGEPVAIESAEGRAIARGPAYRAAFDPGSIAFTATAGGAQEPELRWRVTSVRRGGGPERAAPSPVREVLESSVLYRRPGYVERYDAGRAGIEQSFVFDALPRGAGDLVVRLSVETTLRPPPVGRSVRGLRFVGEEAAVTIGRVVGIDARGERVEGWLQWSAGALELGLPGEFVERAALPLVLDPLIGSQILVALGQREFTRLDAAYDASEDVYLVAYSSTVAGTTQIVAQRYRSSGSRLGSRLTIVVTTPGARVRVANIALRNAFLVAYSSGGAVWVRGVHAATGAMTPLTVAAADVASTSDWGDLGGEATNADDEALMIYENASGRIVGKQITYAQDGSLAVFDTTTIYTPPSDDVLSQPRIAKSGGPTGRFLVVWQRFDRSASNNRIEGALVDRNLTVLDAFVPVHPTQGSGPDVDGDGTNWTVAYQERSASGDPDIYARSLAFDAASSQVLPLARVAVEADANDVETLPRVAWVGESSLVVYLDRDGSQDEVYAKSVDPFTCRVCEVQFAIEESAEDTADLAIVAQRSGRPTVGEEALILWENREANLSMILGRRYVAEDGVVTDLRGGCGSAGTAHATCARVGHQEFELRVRDNEPNRAGVVLLGLDRRTLSCGGCTLIPDPFTSLRVLAFGRNETLAIPIPDAAGVRGTEFYVQWAFTSASPQCAALGMDFSNALRVRIQ